MKADITEQHMILDKVKDGDQKYLKGLYEQYRKEFAQWALKHYNIDDDVAAEIYQRAFIAFYYNVKEGKLTVMNSSLKTYLFAIGKNMLREHFKGESRFVESDEHVLESGEIDNSILEKYEKAEVRRELENLLQRIGEPCKTVLELYYFHNYSLEAIADRMQYKTEQIAAKRKFICLKQLKTMMQTQTS